MNPPRRVGVRVLTEQCATCIFRPGNLMHLQPGRLKEMVEKCRSAGRHVVCHEFLDVPGGYDVAGPAARGAICRGSWDTIEHHQWLQVAERLGLIVWLASPSSPSTHAETH